MTKSSITVVSYEDRVEALVGVKLLALSLQAYSPGVPLHFFAPGEGVPDAFRNWVASRAPSVVIKDVPPGAEQGWSAKPFMIREMLVAGHPEVIWMDSDIIVTQDIRPRFAALPEATLSVASHPGTSDPRRATVWGFSINRHLVASINTCLVRATPAHIPLIDTWIRLTQEPMFREAQRAEFSKRPVALFSDQDLLEGILISDGLLSKYQPDLDFVRHGTEILHGGAVSLRQLMSTRYGLPMFVHGHGLKPWNLEYIAGVHRQKLKYVCLELSLFCWIARRYAASLDEPALELWVYPRSVLGVLSWLLTGNHPSLRQVPVHVLRSIAARISQSL
jgi:hypothetical protein